RASISPSVSVPYWAGSRLPNMLRFTPCSTRTFISIPTGLAAALRELDGGARPLEESARALVARLLQQRMRFAGLALDDEALRDIEPRLAFPGGALLLVLRGRGHQRVAIDLAEQVLEDGRRPVASLEPGGALLQHVARIHAAPGAREVEPERVVAVG